MNERKKSSNVLRVSIVSNKILYRHFKSFLAISLYPLVFVYVLQDLMLQVLI